MYSQWIAQTALQGIPKMILLHLHIIFFQAQSWEGPENLSGAYSSFHGVRLLGFQRPYLGSLWKVCHPLKSYFDVMQNTAFYIVSVHRGELCPLHFGGEQILDLCRVA